MILADVHCHLDFFEEGHDEIIIRARNAGVKAAINNGVNPEKNRKTIELAQKYDIVKAALGIYPTDAEKMTDSEIEEELLFIEKQKDRIIALGEIGLDNVAKDPMKLSRQKEILKKFFTLSWKLRKPMILHSRKAEPEIVDMLEEHRIKSCVLHCFNGNFKLIRRAADAGCYFSIPANIVRMEHFQKMAKELPLSKILTETDAPFLSPFREKKNEPAFIIETIRMIAKIKGLTEEETANNIWMNFQRVF